MFQSLLSLRLACLLALSCMTAASAQRLPANVRPTHYMLHVSPHIAQATFDGDETIDVELAAPATTVTLNAIKLTIASATANGSTTAAGQTAQVSFDPAQEQATLTFAQPLPAGRNTLALHFAGVLNDKLRGFYLSKTGSGATTRNYAVTQFESTDARRAFPSFDEPALKATFDVALTIDARDTAISNGNVTADRREPDGRHTVTFATTPRMSTYLVAFLVGDFRCSKGKADGVPIRVCATPDKVKLTKFALEASEHFLHYYDTYFGIKYPMPKLDLIAIPDFEAGAMENFGAITYRETDLLVQPKGSTINARKRVASVVAHEMAHQWFGDMVTMQWWDNLWLNEGFATWMQDKAANDWHPEWGFPLDVASSLDGTLNFDAGKTTRTIRAKVETPAQIEQMFDGISYGKGGAVLGMVEHWLGPQVFRQGVHNYLSAHLFGNATAEDFWSAQTANAHQPVDTVMASFVDRPGVPLLRFQDPQPAGVPVMQQRFYLAGITADERAASDVSTGWTIPVCVKTATAPVCTVAPGSLSALPAPALPFFFADADGKGYYRTAYTPAQTRAIDAAVETGLTVPERLAYLGDRWALMRAGLGSVGSYLDLAISVRQDPNAAVLGTTLSSIASVRTRIASEADRPALDAVVRAQYGPVFAALPAESHRQARTDAELNLSERRTELFGALGAAGDPAVLSRARMLADQLFAGRKVAEPEIIDEAVGLAARDGDAAFYDKLQIVSRNTADPGLAAEALHVLAQFDRPELIVRTLEYATSGQVRNQDSWVLIAIELGRQASQAVAWDWVRQHWDLVKGQLTTASGSGVVGATGSFCSAARHEEVAAFFAAHPVPATDRALTRALETIDACTAQRQVQEPGLAAWLAVRH